MKLLLTLVTATLLIVPRLSAIMFTYEGFVQSVQPGVNWSINGLQVGAAFQAKLEISDDLVGQDLFSYYIATGFHPARLEFRVSDESIYLSPYYFLEASVNSHDFGIRGEGFGFGSSWGMFGSGGVEGSSWGAGADRDGGPTFTASANLVPSTNVPDAGTTAPLLLIGVGSLFLCVRYQTAKGTPKQLD
jgi:hypothetical protein